MLILRSGKQLRAHVHTTSRKYLVTQSQPSIEVSRSTDSEYTEKPQYPEIKDLSAKARKVATEEDWHEEIRKLPTVEEKLIKINMPRYYGYKAVQLSEEKLPYNCLTAVQHYTRTIFEQMKAIEPAATEQLKSTSQLDSFVQAIKGEVQDGLEFAHDFFRHKYADSSQLDAVQRENELTQLIVEQLNRTFINALAADCEHLREIEIDYNPRHEAFWSVGGINPPKNVKKSKEGQSWSKDIAKEPVNRLIQYTGQPYLSIRHRHQLPTWKSEAETENLELAKQIPRYSYDPRTLGYSTDYRHGTNIPGFWPGSPAGFGCISYHSRACLQLRPKSYGEADFNEALQAQAIQASFGWLLAQANYNGFNTFNELTYPMNTQTVITNGRFWSFYEYQLNTLLVHSRHIDENPRVNNCRGTDELQLYQEIDTNGKCVGLNEQVLRHLLQFYTNAPTVKRTAAELQPFLGAQTKRVADYEDVEKRTFLENQFKHMSSNRPRHLEIPEIYLWEKIYKIDHKTRPLEAKRRFFELGINPWKRTMDQRAKVYVPRVLRPDDKKHRKRYMEKYYP